MANGLDTSQVDPLEKKARSAEESAVQSASQQGVLPQKLRDAVSQRFSRSPVAGQRDEALQNFLTSAPRARADIAEQVQGGTIFSPTQQQSLLASRQAADTVPLVSLNDMLQSQMGSIPELVNAGTGAFQAQVAADQGLADLLRGRADTAFNRLVTERELEIAQQKANQSGQSSQTSPFQQALADMLLQQQSQQPAGNNFTVGDVAIDDQTGQQIIWDGAQWVDASQFFGPGNNTAGTGAGGGGGGASGQSGGGFLSGVGNFLGSLFGG